MAQRPHRVRRVEIEAHVHLDAADRREIIALRIEEQRVEHRFRRVHRRRLARTHDAIDVEQRLLAERVLVDGERVADVGTDIDVVDVEHRQFVEARFDQQRQRLGGDLVARFGEDFAGGGIEEVLREILAVEIFVRARIAFTPFSASRRAARTASFLPASRIDFAGVGVDHIDDGLHALHALGVERHAPALAVLRVE